MNLLCVCVTSGTPWNLPVVQLPQVSLANLTSKTLFETELAYTWEEFGHRDSNRLTHRYAGHPTRTIFASISWGTSWSWWPWRPRGSSLSLVPLNQQKTHHKFALEASNTQKRHWFTQKEHKTGQKKLPWAGQWLLHCLWQRLHFALKTGGLYPSSAISHRAKGSNSKLLVLPQNICQNLG